MINQPDPQLKQKVLSFLEQNCLGRGQALTGDQLSAALGVKEKRTLRTAIHELREAGEPILSISVYPAGYFIPASPDEVETGISEFTGRIIEMRKVCKGIRQGLEKRFPGQQIKLDFDLEAKIADG